MVEQLRHHKEWAPEFVDGRIEHVDVRDLVRQASPLTCSCGARLGNHKFAELADAAFREHLLTIDAMTKLFDGIDDEASVEVLAAEVVARSTLPEAG